MLEVVHHEVGGPRLASSQLKPSSDLWLLGIDRAKTSRPPQQHTTTTENPTDSHWPRLGAPKLYSSEQLTQPQSFATTLEQSREGKHDGSVNTNADK